MTPMLRLYGYSVRAGVSIGMAIGALCGAIIGGGGGTLGAVLITALLGTLVGGLIAVVPSLVGAGVLVAVARNSSNLRRDVAFVFAAVIGVLDALSLVTDPATWPGVLLVNAVMAPMLWWAWRILVRTAEEAV